MKRSTARQAVSLLLILILALGCVSPARAGETKKKATVMVYMCGSDLEGRGKQGSGAISQMLSSGFDPEQISVVLLLGGSVSWKLGFDPGALTLLRLEVTAPVVEETWPLAPMSEAETLSRFLTECKEKYPAETYILDIWDHGGGPVYGVCQDTLFRNDLLEAGELVEALKNSPFADGSLDLIALNCCLMGSAELCALLSPFARYLAAAEDSMFGLAYDWLAGLENDPDILATAKRLVDSSFVLNEEVISRQHAGLINSFSVVDLAKMPALAAAADEFFSRVGGGLDDQSFSLISGRCGSAAAFGRGTGDGSSGFDLIDLGDLARQYEDEFPEGAKALLSAIDDAVIYRRSALENCTGLTVYHPYANKARLDERIAVYNTLDFSKGYTAYVQRFAACLTGTPLARWTELYTASKRAVKDQRTLFTLPLTEAQARHFSSAELMVLRKDGQGAYTFAYTNPRTRFDGENVTGEYVKNALYAVDGEGNRLSGEIEYTVNSQGIYYVPAVLCRRDGGTEETAYRALIACACDPDTKKLSPGGVLVWEESMGGYTTAYNAVFTDYDKIQITFSSRCETRDENGALLSFSRWEIAETLIWTRPIDGAWGFSLLSDPPDPASLFAAFQVTDSQQNAYLSELLAVKVSALDAAVRTDYDDAGLVLISGLNLAPGQGELLLSLNVVNLTDREAIIRLEGLTVNGVALAAQAEAYGSGKYWGLLPLEEQLLLLPIGLSSLQGADAVTSMAFDLRLLDAVSDEPLGSVPVSVTMNLTGLRGE